MHRQLIWGVTLIAWGGGLTTAPAAEDQLLLKNGGQVVGTILRRPSPGASDEEASYLVRLSDGIHAKIAASQVGRVVEPTAEEEQYEQLLPEMPDTARGHEAMAKWCQQHGLGDRKEFHWRQVLRHDTNHAEARRALGYGMLGGKWTRPEDFMEAQGYIRYKGTWRLPQQVAVLEQEREIELAQKEWRKNLRVWRGWLGGRRHGEAMQRLRDVSDPLAAMGLAELLAAESDPALRAMYVDSLARIGGSNVVNALLASALNDDDLEVRLRCIDHLKQLGRIPALTAFTQGLASKDNRMVNRAAVGLGRLGDPEAIVPLIEALVTQHETIVQPAGNIRPSFGGTSDGSGGMNGLSVGGGPQKIIQHVQNKSVLEALIGLTKQNYRYAEDDWKTWYVRAHSLPSDVNLRRD